MDIANFRSPFETGIRGRGLAKSANAESERKILEIGASKIPEMRVRRRISWQSKSPVSGASGRDRRVRQGVSPCRRCAGAAPRRRPHRHAVGLRRRIRCRGAGGHHRDLGHQAMGRTSYGERQYAAGGDSSSSWMNAANPFPRGFTIFLAVIGAIIAALIALHLAGGGPHHNGR